MEDPKFHYRHVMLFCFNSGENASKMCDESCSVYSKITLCVFKKLFSQFRSGNFLIEYASRSGRPIVIENTRVSDILAYKTGRQW